MTRQADTFSLVGIDAVIFDLDGVLTDTAAAHSKAWKQAFDAFLRERRGEDFEPFTDEDYQRYVDGKPRYEGVQSFLESRDIELPWGSPEDAPGHDTICALGNEKNEYYQEFLSQGDVETFGDAILFVEALRRRGVATAVVSSSKNTPTVLEQAELTELFDARVDGNDLADGELRGKPAPDMFVEAARRIGVDPGRAVVVEDAESGVEAGAAGGFATVIGVARGTNRDGLAAAGADIVIDSFEELDITGDPMPDQLSDAMNSVPEIADRVGNREVAVFLDYDGTLTPIVDDPEAAVLSDEMRESVRHLADVSPVAVVSGRDLQDVRQRVGVDDIAYAGSHGFDILGAEDEKMSLDKGEDFLPALDRAEEELERRLADIDGAKLERKKYSLAIHYRNVADEDVDAVEEHVDAVLGEVDELRKTHGKKVFDLQPDIDWHKGKAVDWLLEKLGLADDGVVPMYIGDDVTDEDAFRALAGRGITVAVQDVAAETAAEYRLADPAAVQQFLDALANRLQARQ